VVPCSKTTSTFVSTLQSAWAKNKITCNIVHHVFLLAAHQGKNISLGRVPLKINLGWRGHAF